MTERISIVTDEIDQDLDTVRAFLDLHEVGAIELRMIRGRRVPDLDARDRETIRSWVRTDATRVLAVSPGTFKCHRDDRAEIRRNVREVLPRAVDLAYEFDAPFVVTFSLENPDGAPLDDGVIEPLREAADRAASAEIPLLVENEPGFMASSASTTRALLEAAGHPNLFANWDPLNGNEFEEEPLSDGLRELFPHVRHVHVKNGHLEPGRLLATCCSLRSGAIDWPAHLRLLAELGYEGHLGVETHYEPFGKSSIVVLRELREMVSEVGFAWGRGS